MTIKFTYRLQAEEWRAGVGALTHEIAQIADAGNRLVRIQLAATIVSAVLVIAIWPNSFLPLLVAICVYGVGQAVAIKVVDRKIQSPTYDEGNAAELRVRFGPDGFTDTSAFRSRRWRWSALRAIRRADEVTVLILAGWDILVLPDRLWETAEARDSCIDQLRRWSGQPGETPVAPATTVNDLVPWPLIGGLAAGLTANILVFPWLISSAIPFLSDPRPLVRGAIVVAAIAAGFALGYVIYKVVRAQLEKLTASRRAQVAQALTWLFPLYILAAWLGWI